MFDYDKTFKENLPDSLYLNHYQLAETYGGTPNGWRKYISENEMFITREITAITEANARRALQLLGEGKVDSKTASAVRTLLDRSEQLNEQYKDQTTFMLTFMPAPDPDLVFQPEQHANTSFSLEPEELEVEDLPDYVRDGYGLYTILDENDQPVFDAERYLLEKEFQIERIVEFTPEAFGYYVKYLKALKNKAGESA